MVLQVLDQNVSKNSEADVAQVAEAGVPYEVAERVKEVLGKENY